MVLNTLPEGFRTEFLSEDVFMPLWKQHRDQIFDAHFSISPRLFYSDADKQIIEQMDNRLQENRFNLYLALFDGDRLIGWSFGWQERAGSFYMCNSAVLPEYRRKGLYTLIVDTVVQEVYAQGFQSVYSRHHVTNNAVIIAKMRYGFMISGMEIDDHFGTLVRLTHYRKDCRKAVLQYRAGESRLLPDAGGGCS